jgi:signal transduction histidine kinase
LHDHIIQSIYAIGLGLEEGQRLIEERESSKALKKLDKSIKELNGVIADVRGYISGLEEGLVTGQQLRAMLARLVGTMESPQAIRFRLDVDPKAVNRLTPEEATHVLYIAQEAMSNSLRHSGGRSGQVLIRAHEGNVQLEISDDGVGFDPDRHTKLGRGLQNLSARAKQLGARVKIVSKRGQGTQIILDIPKEKQHVGL